MTVGTKLSPGIKGTPGGGAVKGRGKDRVKYAQCIM